LIRITSRVDLAMSVCPFVRVNAMISETIKNVILGLGMQILEIPAQRKFVSLVCHAHTYAHKPPKPIGSETLSSTCYIVSDKCSIPFYSTRNGYKTSKNAIVEYPDYQIPVTQPKEPKGNGDIQAAQRD